MEYMIHLSSAELAQRVVKVKYSDTLTPYHTCCKIWTSLFYYMLTCLKHAIWMANSVNPEHAICFYSIWSGSTLIAKACLSVRILGKKYGKHFFIQTPRFSKAMHAMGKWSRQQIDDIFLTLFFPENRFWKCMQIVSYLRRQFAKNVKACFLGRIRKIFQNDICWKFYPEC